MDKTLTPAPILPGRLSMLMHVITYRLLKKYGYEYTTLEILPLPSMFRILQKAGFVSPDLNPMNLHNVTLNRKDLIKLHLYLSKSKEVVVVSPNINSCIICGNELQLQCTYCKQAILCNTCIDHDVHERD